ncbi:MAG: hypothetical protein AAF364_18540 [Pseudomonadota bacterium]
MQLFFSSLQELERFTHSLQSLPKDNTCEHCNRNDQWVSHGYVYKQRSLDKRGIAGKRIVCARRFGKLGCGRTRQLYLNNIVPKRHYLLSVILTFIAELIRGKSVQPAYHQALGHDHYSPRQAWRWLDALMQRLPLCRLHIKSAQESQLPHAGWRTNRQKVLLPSLKALSQKESLQTYLQQAFV